MLAALDPHDCVNRLKHFSALVVSRFGPRQTPNRKIFTAQARRFLLPRPSHPATMVRLAYHRSAFPRRTLAAWLHFLRASARFAKGSAPYDEKLAALERRPKRNRGAVQSFAERFRFLSSEKKRTDLEKRSENHTICSEFIQVFRRPAANS